MSTCDATQHLKRPSILLESVVHYQEVAGATVTAVLTVKTKTATGHIPKSVLLLLLYSIVVIMKHRWNELRDWKCKNNRSHNSQQNVNKKFYLWTMFTFSFTFFNLFRVRSCWFFVLHYKNITSIRIQLFPESNITFRKSRNENKRRR